MHYTKYTKMNNGHLDDELALGVVRVQVGRLQPLVPGPLELEVAEVVGEPRHEALVRARVHGGDALVQEFYRLGEYLEHTNNILSYHRYMHESLTSQNIFRYFGTEKQTRLLTWNNVYFSWKNETKTFLCRVCLSNRYDGLYDITVIVA